MKQLLKRRERLVRVRNVQHLQASAAAAQAETRVATLETSAARLVALRGSLTPETGAVFAAALSNAGELSMRLEAARHGMTDAIANARASADRLGAMRLEARVRQESAEKLGERAEAAYAEWRERRTATPHRRKAGGTPA
ncbi:hypothetical protein [Sphingomonas profundi]|uniref:hypothetical protein n=1 Tax=Alterirhizorhabdus profundi TaxID=2681549 RepID=UPI0012E8CF15|nr:hypothetical protein [Sphingomonas profundi]